MDKNNKRVFIEFVLTYFMMIALVLVCLIPIYTSLARSERDKSAQAIADYAKSSMRELETEENLMFHAARNLFQDRELRGFYYKSASPEDPALFYNMSQLQQRLKLYFQNMGDVREVTVYLPKFNYVLTQKYIFRSREEFYQNCEYNSYENQDWLEEFFKTNYNIAINSGLFFDRLENSSYEVMNHVFAFPMAGDANIKLLVMITLDAPSVAQRLLLPEVRNQAYARIEDKKEASLAVYGPDQAAETDYEKFFFTSDNGKLVTVGVNRQYYSNIGRKTMKRIFGSIGIAMVVGAGAALYFAWNRSKPIERIFDIIRRDHGEEEGSRNLVGLEDSIVVMVSEIQHCRDTIRDLDSMVSHNLLDKLFFGDLAQAKAQTAFVQYYGDMPSACVAVVFAGESHISETDLKAKIEALFCQMERNIYVIREHKNRVYLLMENHETRLLLESILKKIREEEEWVIKAGISNPVTGLSTVKGAVMQAERRLDAGCQIQGIYLFFHTYSSRTDHNLLKVQSLDALQRVLLGGNCQASDKIIADIFDHVEPERVDAVEFRQIFFTLRSVYSMVLNQFTLESERAGETVSEEIPIPNDLDEYSPESVKNAFLALNKVIFERYQIQRDRSVRIKGLDIMAYVEEHYADPNLYASTIASHFGLSEKYVFQLVKGVSGETLNDRISFLRVQEAVRLLEETELSVSEIASRVGFASSNSMYKVFMRVKGISPSAYRKNNNETGERYESNHGDV